MTAVWNVSNVLWPFVRVVLNSDTPDAVRRTEEYVFLQQACDCVAQSDGGVLMVEESCVWYRGRQGCITDAEKTYYEEESGAYQFRNVDELFRVLADMYQKDTETFPAGYYASDMSTVYQFMEKIAFFNRQEEAKADESWDNSMEIENVTE